jgi:regulator of nonsense transcripts 2
MMAETSSEARKVDRRTAQALWNSSGAHRKKRADQVGGSGNEEEDPEKMKFTVLSRRGHKQQVKPFLNR